MAGDREEFDGDVIWRWRPPVTPSYRARGTADEYVIVRQGLADHGLIIYSRYDGRWLANDPTAARPVVGELLQRLHRLAQQALDVRILALAVKASSRVAQVGECRVNDRCLRCRRWQSVGGVTGHCDTCAQDALAELAQLALTLGGAA